MATEPTETAAAHRCTPKRPCSDPLEPHCPPEDTLHDRRYWESLSDADLDRAIDGARADRDGFQKQVDDAQRFADALTSIRVERRAAARDARNGT